MMFRRFIHEEEGATAIEYALIASLLSMVIVGALLVIGGALASTFTVVSDHV